MDNHFLIRFDQLFCVITAAISKLFIWSFGAQPELRQYVVVMFCGVFHSCLIFTRRKSSSGCPRYLQYRQNTGSLIVYEA
jgi:hypothetical protein